MKAVLLLLACVTVSVAFLGRGTARPRVLKGSVATMTPPPTQQGQQGAFKGLASVVTIAGLMWNMPIGEMVTPSAHAVTTSSSRSQLKDELASLKDTEKAADATAGAPAGKKPAAAKKNSRKAIEVPAVSAAEAQAAADAAVKAAVKAADPPKSPASVKLDVTATKKKQVEISAPKKSVEEVALTSVQEKLQVNKDRLMVVMKNELPRARDELKKAKSEGSILESKLNKVQNEKKAAQKKNVEKGAMRLLDGELTDLKKRLGFVNQEISGYTKAVERSENESARLKKEISRQADLMKVLRERFKTKTVELKAKEKKQAEEERRKEFARDKQDAQRRVSFEKGKVGDVTKEANAAAYNLKKLKAKRGDLEVDLKLARKEESKRIKLVNDLRGVLQKEMSALEKQQAKIVDINQNLGETAATVAGVERDFSVKEEALSAAKAKYKTAETASKKFGD